MSSGLTQCNTTQYPSIRYLKFNFCVYWRWLSTLELKENIIKLLFSAFTSLKWVRNWSSYINSGGVWTLHELRYAKISTQTWHQISVLLIILFPTFKFLLPIYLPSYTLRLFWLKSEFFLNRLHEINHISISKWSLIYMRCWNI